MTLDEAKAVLAGLSAYVDTESQTDQWTLDGRFTLEEVEALGVIAQEQRRQEAQVTAE